MTLLEWAKRKRKKKRSLEVRLLESEIWRVSRADKHYYAMRCSGDTYFLNEPLSIICNLLQIVGNIRKGSPESNCGYYY